MHRLVAALCLLVAGCAWAPTWGVYKIDVNQGNFITQDLVDKLKVGQTKSQVRLILGTPLVADAFHANRWDYVFRYESGGRVLEERKFMALFQDDKLTKWGGDELPISPVRGYAGERKEGVTTSVSVDDKSWWGTIRDIFGW
jgi:outer membrane protein assembly factor BamE